jgi:hypothetical protein
VLQLETRGLDPASPDFVDGGGAVEPGHDRHPPGHGRGLEPADLLHPPHVELDVRALRGERIETPLRAPAQIHPNVGLDVATGQALVAGEVTSHRAPQQVGSIGRVGRIRQLGQGQDFHDAGHSSTVRRDVRDEVTSYKLTCVMWVRQGNLGWWVSIR